mgnify:CR=1 FL=1
MVLLIQRGDYWIFYDAQTFDDLRQNCIMLRLSNNNMMMIVVF